MKTKNYDFNVATNVTDLVGQQRILFSYTNRGKKNTLNGVTLLLPDDWFMEDWVYIQKQNNGFLLSKTPIENSIPREVKRNTGTRQCRINFRNIAEEEKMYYVFKVKNGYFLQESEYDIPKKNTRTRNLEEGMVITKANSVCIPKKYLHEICKDMTDSAYVIITEHYKPYKYVTLDFKQKSEMQEDEFGSEIRPYAPMKYRMNKTKSVRTLKVSPRTTAVRLSRFYMEAAKLTVGDKIFIHKIDGRTITLTNSEKICKICGKPIQEYKEKVFNMNACSTCGFSAKVLSSQLEQHHNLSEIKEKLLKCQEALTEFVNESEEK